MNNSLFIRLIVIAASLIGGTALLLLRSRLAPKESGGEVQSLKKLNRLRFIMFVAAVILLWFCCGTVIDIFYQPADEGLHVEMMAPRVEIFGVSLSTSVVIGWGAMLVVIIPALLIRIFAVPKFGEEPEGIQAALETAIEYLADYTKEKAGFVSESLNAYMMTLALFLIGSAVTELFSFRPPTSDIVTTFSLALITFFMINYYGIKEKGVGGRLKGFAEPIPVVFPFRVLSDIAIPVSLACRLFGNMLGGMIVLHLVYMALGSFGVGIPAVLGLYFNVFHPLIQVFIFITLSLTFIGEAVE